MQQVDVGTSEVVDEVEVVRFYGLGIHHEGELSVACCCEAYGHLAFGGLDGGGGIVGLVVQHIHVRHFFVESHLAQRVTLANLHVGAVHEAFIASLDANIGGLGIPLAFGGGVEHDVLALGSSLHDEALSRLDVVVGREGACFKFGTVFNHVISGKRCAIYLDFAISEVAREGVAHEVEAFQAALSRVTQWHGDFSIGGFHATCETGRFFGGVGVKVALTSIEGGEAVCSFSVPPFMGGFVVKV